MDNIKIEKVDLEKMDLVKILGQYFKHQDKYQPFIRAANSPKYLYWDKIKYHETPDDLSKEETWFLIKQIRLLSSESTQIQTENGDKFRWYRLPKTDEYLHTIDFYTGGHVFAPFKVLKDIDEQKFLGRGILEEAIASSQIEGANTTRRAAKKMILENRPPRNHSELMIINNYKVMKNIEEEYRQHELSKELLMKIHADLLDGDSEVPDDEKHRFREDKDEIIVHDGSKIAHVPPKNKFVMSELDRLIDYANDKSDEGFVHPVIKAIFLHFWIGYLHPFTDGNGRLARAIFYWYLLRKDYWTILYLPISTVIKKSRKQYDRAYIYSEQDDLDLTYFFDYNIRKIVQSINEFQEYLNRIELENKVVDKLLSKDYDLNPRQKQLIYYLIEQGDGAYSTATSHGTINSISRQTAAQDLKQLEELGLLLNKKSGFYVRYYPTSKLTDLIERRVI